jgi:hypothetical protein
MTTFCGTPLPVHCMCPALPTLVWMLLSLCGLYIICIVSCLCSHDWPLAVCSALWDYSIVCILCTSCLIVRHYRCTLFYCNSKRSIIMPTVTLSTVYYCNICPFSFLRMCRCYSSWYCVSCSANFWVYAAVLLGSLFCWDVAPCHWWLVSDVWDNVVIASLVVKKSVKNA